MTPPAKEIDSMTTRAAPDAEELRKLCLEIMSFPILDRLSEVAHKLALKVEDGLSAAPTLTEGEVVGASDDAVGRGTPREPDWKAATERLLEHLDVMADITESELDLEDQADIDAIRAWFKPGFPSVSSATLDRNAVIEECARIAELECWSATDPFEATIRRAQRGIAAAIRALKSPAR